MVRTQSGAKSTKVAWSAPLDKASRPTEPEPAKRSRWRSLLSFMLNTPIDVRLENTASRTLPIMGRRYTSGESRRRPRAEPPRIFRRLGLFMPSSAARPWRRFLRVGLSVASTCQHAEALTAHSSYEARGSTAGCCPPSLARRRPRRRWRGAPAPAAEAGGGHGTAERAAAAAAERHCATERSWD
eukprot:scaffold1390_cov249-Pinguiococcus_pyrenoidosus.AAC.24